REAGNGEGVNEMEGDMILRMAVNDPANGKHTGQCDQVELRHYPVESWVTEVLIALEGEPVTHGLANGGKMTAGDVTVRIWDYTAWTGNWCWDSAILDRGEAVKVLAHLRECGWTVTEGETVLVDRYEVAPLTEEDLLMREGVIGG